jgi:uncharacterized protein (DUF488 family)
MPRQLFTTGYEGRTLATFITDLRANNIDCILDVRALAFSRKPGFSKTQLARSLKRAKIQYVHLPALGTPKHIRENLKSTGDYATFFKTMERRLANNKEAIEAAYRLAINHTCCLMCFERLADHCHRKIVAGTIKARDGNGLRIKHI